MSGIRTPPPISTSSPRETATPRPRPARATANPTAAALLFVTSASSAPVSAIRCSSASRKRGPRRPLPRSISRRSEPAAEAAASTASSGHGARPRFVWTITPVALIAATAGRATHDSRRAITVSARAASGVGVTSAAARRARSSARTARATMTSEWWFWPAGRRGRTAASSTSTLGGRTERTEPAGRFGVGRARPGPAVIHVLLTPGLAVAGAHGSRTHHAAPSAASPVLKTGGPTGTQPLP